MEIEINDLNFETERSKSKFACLDEYSKRIRVPSLDKDFALFLGLLWGDGWITNRKSSIKHGQWRVGLVGNDKLLINEYIELVKKLFSINPKIHDRKTKIEVYFGNRIVYELLNRKLYFPDGEKKGRLKIPPQVAINKELVTQFLRGLFSTDGSFVIYNNYPRVRLNSATYELIDDVRRLLANMDFNPRIYIENRDKGNKLYGLSLNGKTQVYLFYKKINFLGKKVYKLESFINNNLDLVPSRDIESRGI